MVWVRLTPPAVRAALAGAYAWWVTGLAPFAETTTVAVVGAGGVAALAAYATRPPGSARPAGPAPLAGRGAAVWLALLTGLVLWQVAAYFQQPRSAHPTLSSLANTALEARPVRASAFVAWLAGAAWLARR
jgi:hypothetical protein